MKKIKFNIWWQRLWPIFLGVLIVGVVQILLSVFGLRNINLTGNSMSPTYKDGTFLFIKEQTPKRTDLIVFNPPSSWDPDAKTKKYIKRVVALEGDTVEIAPAEVRVNGKTVRQWDPEVTGNSVEKTRVFKVPSGKFFVLGDNKENSNDSLYEFFSSSPEIFVSEKDTFVVGQPVFKFYYKFWKG